MKEEIPMQDKAKQLLKILNRCDISKYSATDEALELMQEYDMETGAINMIDDDSIDELIKNEVDAGGWQRVACFLGGIKTLNTPFGYKLDGYGNLDEITFDDIRLYIEEIANS